MEHSNISHRVPLENIPIRINVAGVEVCGTVIQLFPNDINVRIDDGTGRAKGLHAPYFQMALARQHYATVDEYGTRRITPHGRHVANRLVAALYRGER